MDVPAQSLAREIPRRSKARMRALSKSLVAVVCCLAVQISAVAQTPVPGQIPSPAPSGEQRTTEVVVAPVVESEVLADESEQPAVFSKVGEGPKPAPDPDAVKPGAI